jgi:dGTPase
LPQKDEIRCQLERKEESLSPYAAKSKLSRGRERYEPQSPLRTEFQRDRDRILYTKAFRRLMHKTQVFITPLGDHYTTRLTHTLEVAQISRSIVRALNLNEDLAEAISLGHDLGHTPFGHVGEETLNEIYPEGFSHNEQSLRVVDILENNGLGLNLTWEVREGIVKHSKTRQKILGQDWEPSSTLEAQVCKLADSIAFINHDLNDAIRAGLITEQDLSSSATVVLGRSQRERINTLILDVVEQSWSATGLQGDKVPLISMSPEVLKAANTLCSFLFERVYDAQAAKEETKRAREVLRFLYRYFNQNPDKLPAGFLRHGDSVARAVVDYIAGMTDNYALMVAHECNG